MVLENHFQPHLKLSHLQGCNQSGASRLSTALGSTLSLNDDVSIVKHLNIHHGIMHSNFLQDSVSECRERCKQELEELRKHQSERVQLLLQQHEKKKEELKKEYGEKLKAMKVENERVLSQLLKENESQEALMLAKHDGEERAARKADELKIERNDSLRPSAPSLPQVPECPVGNLTELRTLKTSITTSKNLCS